MIEIRLARENELSHLQKVEEAAGALFLAYDETKDLPAALETTDQLYTAQQNGCLWVAAQQSGDPVGFALVEILGGNAHLEELDVDPAFGRQGIGTSLVKTVCAWAAAKGLSMVTLTTFRDIPWNGPFYRKLGFAELKPHELTPALLDRIAEEDRHGLKRNLRIAMGYKISETTKNWSSSIVNGKTHSQNEG